MTWFSPIFTPNVSSHKKKKKMTMWVSLYKIRDVSGQPNYSTFEIHQSRSFCIVKPAALTITICVLARETSLELSLPMPTQPKTSTIVPFWTSNRKQAFSSPLPLMSLEPSEEAIEYSWPSTSCDIQFPSTYGRSRCREFSEKISWQSTNVLVRTG